MMAETVSTSCSIPSAALDDLHHHLTCAVCLSQYDSPKTLPCLHFFCLKCIQQLPVDLQKEKYVIVCPTCRKTAHLPDNGPANLPTAFLINNLKDIQEKLKKATESSSRDKQISCDNCEGRRATRYCKQCAFGFCEKCLGIHNGLRANANHQIIGINTGSSIRPGLLTNCTDHNKPHEIFCETCQELICRDCTIRRHKDHDYDLITDSFPKHQQDIKITLGAVLDKIIALRHVLTALTTREEGIMKQRDERMKEIRHLIERIVESAQRCGEQLVEEVGKVAEGKLQLLGQQKVEAETALMQLKSCKEFVEKGLEVGSPQQILSEKQTLIEGMEAVSNHIDPAVFEPVEEANITFAENKMAVESCRSLGMLKYSFSPIKGNLITSDSSGSIVTVTFGLQTKLGSPCKIPQSLPLTCHLIPPDTSQAVVCDIEETEVGKYAVSFAPSARGVHQLKLQVRGDDINDSPFSFHVVPSPEMRNKPIKIISGLDEPCYVAVEKNGNLLVTEHYRPRCVTVYDKEGKRVRSFALLEGERGARGVSVTNDGHILVTVKHALLKLTPDGRCIMSVGNSEGAGSKGAGSGPLQFSYPRGIAVCPATGRIYVADNRNHRVQVINDDFTYSHSIGSYGTTPGHLLYPYDVACDGDTVYVTDYSNNSIDVFTLDGRHLRRFGSYGSREGRLIYPTSIAIDANSLVYVAEGGNSRVSIFTSGGQFIRCVGCGEGEFKGLYGIAVDALGNLYVSDSGNNRIVVL